MVNNNPDLNLNNLFKAELSASDFKRLSEFIMTEYGIKMPPEKTVMLQSRLQKRLKALGIDNFKHYVDYVFSPQGQSEEVIHMMDVVSTNKTDFFRESIHFDYLLEQILPKFNKELNTNIINIWSAGCSSGEEPYTIAITMSEYIERHQAFNYQIKASDISTNMLKKAANAVYSEEKIIDIPLVLKKKYFLKSKNREAQQVRVIKALREKVSYFRINLLELKPAKPEFHLIFCRNVLIYFDRETQYKILSNLCSQLLLGGYLFLGHSESITGFDLPLKHTIPTVYYKI